MSSFSNRMCLIFAILFKCKKEVLEMMSFDIPLPCNMNNKLFNSLLLGLEL